MGAAEIAQSPQHSVAVTSAGTISHCGLPSGISSSQNSARRLCSVSVITSPGSKTPATTVAQVAFEPPLVQTVRLASSSVAGSMLKNLLCSYTLMRNRQNPEDGKV